MLITAHGGALGTGRNTQRYFDTIKDYKIDAIEVDVQRKKDLLYIAHTPKIRVKKAITLEYVFEYIKENDLKVNCDLKRKGLIKAVLSLAKKKGVEDRIIFTGSMSPHDIKNLTVGQAYLNSGFFFPLLPFSRNLPTIKRVITNLDNPQIKGINIRHNYCSDEMLEMAEKVELSLSVYTVDKPEAIKRLKAKTPIANITTNNITEITNKK
ncbi:MAG: glycerophosphodiester phosphodiesterase [Bacillota bacterium]